MTELVTIDHGFRSVFICGTAYSRKQLLPHMKRLDRFSYIVGDTKPNYPLPVTDNLAATMLIAGLGEYTLAAMWSE